MRSFAVIAVLAGALVVPVAASAQTRVAVYRGIGEYDLAGVDDAPVTAVRLSRTLARLVTVEAGVTHVELKPDLDPETTLLQPELQAQLHLPLGVFAPYVGAGLGAAFASAEGADSESEITLNAGLGLRVELPFGLGVGLDGRLRGFGTDFTGSGADATIGISYRF